jgi:hypothetical protein
MNTTQHTDNPFPALSEEGKEQAARLIEDFKKAMANAAEEALASLYSDVMPYIEGDSWSNFRRDAINQLKGYNRGAITYGRRYNVLALAGVAPEDDDGNAASNIKAEDRRDKDALMAITDTQLKEANRLLKILDATEDNIAATVRLFTKDRTESVEGMMKPEAEAIIKALRKRVSKDKSAV